MKSFLDRFRRKGPEEDEGKKPETAGGDMAAAREPVIPGRAGPVPRGAASAPAVTSTDAVAILSSDL